MSISTRQHRIIELLSASPNITVYELAKQLSVSEPTIRRDFTELENRGFIEKFYGGARLLKGAADSEIPFLIRENEKSRAKVEMGRQAAGLIQDGMVLMLDGSTSAYNIVPYLKDFKDLIVVTSGAKTAVALAELNIRTFCTGGQMITHSFSYVGKQAEQFIRSINADLLFFSCRGLTQDGRMTDVSMEEANLRQVMFEHSKRKVLLCDSGKLGKVYFYNMGNAHDVDGIISNADIQLCQTNDAQKGRA